MEEARKQRIFNDKVRTIGIDIQAIRKQVEEKQAREKAEKDEMKKYGAQFQSFMDHTMALQQEREKEKKIKTYDLMSQQVNKKHENKTWKIHTPVLNEDLSFSCPSDQSEIPISSLQRFSGEDITKNERIKTQQQQIQEWNGQLAEEKKIKQMAEKENIMRAEELEEQKQMLELNKRYQVSQEQRSQQQRNSQKKETDDSKPCNEDQKRLSPHLWSTKKNKTTFDVENELAIENERKKLLLKFRQGIEEQRQEKMLNLERQKQNERNEYNKQQEITRNFLLNQYELDRIKMQKNREIAENQKQQILENVQKCKIFKEMYENVVKPEYFSQFQTSSR
ncbi:hypothetical protein RFI_35437 [Reticulomyxa filosa]|uniref:Uncharacterized protein n=1 Tax=Reticulomyxa filosa TaxID=46433 RepID=X6LJ87_RETFI|nr:hypothetical protein RFI_35437 [Reticulomyxa filosa]|eukprot:ETO02003.1 hypothetical protein RFI_35437 [Reticulomyxa filosa]